MDKKIKIQLAITIGITIILLLASFFLIRAKAEEYLSKVDEIAGADWEEVEYGGLAFIAAVIAIAGTTIELFAIPLLPPAVTLLPLLIIVSFAKKEKTQKVVTLILMILSIIVAIVMSLYLLGLAFLFMYFAGASSTPLLSFAIVMMLILTVVSLVANAITVIVSYARLRQNCKQLQQQTANEQ